MKIYFKNAAKVSLVVLLVGTFAACKKDNNNASTRQTIVRIKDGEKPITVLARNVNPTVETFQLADIRRDPNDEAGLQQTLVVNIAIDQGVIDTYNSDNGTSFVLLPSDAYTLSDNLSSLTFASGDFVKVVMITLDKSKLDLTKQYALGLKIADAGAGAVASSAYGSAIYSIGVKNQYDGTYDLTGNFYHPAGSPDYGPLPGEPVTVEMHTSGPNSVKIYVPEFGGYYQPIVYGGELDAFGAQEPNYTIDPTTNAVTVQNSYVGATTFYTMAAGFDSHYDPATKTIYARFGYNYDPGPVFNGSTTREWTVTLVYKGPR